MTDEPTMETFETDTGKLYYGGRYLLPSMASRFSLMSSHIEYTRGGFDDEFALGNSPGGNLGTLYFEWDELRSKLQYYFAQTADNLVGTGNALCQLAIEAAETDGKGATEIAEKGAQLDDVTVLEPEYGPTEPNPR